MMRTFTLYYSELDSPVGWLTLTRTNKGLCRLDFGPAEVVLSLVESWGKKHFLNNTITRDDQALQDVREQLDDYFQGKRKKFECELDLIGTPFQRLVWNALLEIPYGEVRSYKEVAQSIGAPQAVRAIGGANNKNNIAIIVPCHRVIGANGALVGYSGGIELKRELLHMERRNAPKGSTYANTR